MAKNRSIKVYGQSGYQYKDTPEEWLDDFNTFSIYQVLLQMIELWGLNVQTDVTAKKNFVQQNVK